MLVAPVCRVALFLAVALTSASAQTRPSTDVWTAPLTGDGVPRVGKAVNLTHRAGYDNQPAFTPDGRAILYTRVEGNAPSDIWRVDLRSLATTRVTMSDVESEYSATPMPDGRHFSAVRVEADSTQRLWRFPMQGSDAPALLLEKIKPVGYHVWASEAVLGLFVLGSPATLQIADVRTGTADTVARRIDRALQKIPGAYAISFLQLGDGENWITRYDLATRTASRIAKAPAGADFHIWTKSGLLITATGSRLLAWVDGEWRQLADLAADGVRNITRLALSPDGTRLAFVAEDRAP